MSAGGPTEDLSVELKLLFVIAGVGAILLFLKGISLLATGGRTGLVIGGTSVAVAFGQFIAFVALYRGRFWAVNAALSLLVTGAMLEGATGDWFGALVELVIAAALYFQRDELG